jgi:hypothetical protein
MKKQRIFFIILLFLIGGGIAMYSGKTFSENDSSKTRRILLIGASVGRGWNLPEWTKRMNDNSVSLEMIPVYSFDKSQALEEALMRPRRKFHFNKSYIKGFFRTAPQKPDMIIIKECAAYFPGDLENYKTLVTKWIHQSIAAGIKPVVATVAPVTQEHSEKKPGRLEGILEYNDWVKSYTKEIGINCLDLESALRISNDDRALSPDLTSGDGLHLNGRAYSIIDITLKENLEQYS